MLKQSSKLNPRASTLHKIELSVHEFMTIMGSLDERLGGKHGHDDGALYDEWYEQWQVLDERLEKLPLMQRADMLFDGKVAINTITEPQLQELIVAVESQVLLHQKLIDDEDEDADADDLEIWQNRLNKLEEAAKSLE